MLDDCFKNSLLKVKKKVRFIAVWFLAKAYSSRLLVCSCDSLFNVFVLLYSIWVYPLFTFPFIWWPLSKKKLTDGLVNEHGCTVGGEWGMTFDRWMDTQLEDSRGLQIWKLGILGQSRNYSGSPSSKLLNLNQSPVLFGFVRPPFCPLHVVALSEDHHWPLPQRHSPTSGKSLSHI